MKGLTIAKPGAPYELASDIPKPTPGPKQVLVKSLYSGINPVETFMQMSGTLVNSWPIVIGCDASGIVVEVGEGVTKFKKGDAIFGCTRLGSAGYGTFQEYHLMDEHLAFSKPKNISLEEAATIGVGALTACLGLISGMGLKFPEKGESPKFDEWIIVLGGSGAVGQFAIQIAKVCGYKVLTTCSPANEALVKGIGASATLNYTDDAATQLSNLLSLTAGGNFSRVIDTTAASTANALRFLEAASRPGSGDDGKRSFATVDDWSQIDIPPSVADYRIRLGGIGQAGDKAEAVTRDIAAFIPPLERLFEEGALKPLPVQMAGSGFEAVPEAIKIQNAGSKGGKKVVVKLQDP